MQPKPIRTLSSGGHGKCSAEGCKCTLWKGGKRGMSGLETCSCGHLSHVHAIGA